MKVLVMGGSQFNGFFLVKELVEQGHEVTVLNRGITEAEFPESVKRVTADRTDLKALQKALGGQEFDCVQDMCAYHPEDTEQAIDIFGGRTGHYIFASSTVIYASTVSLPIDEDHPCERGPDQNEYGLHKLLCEDVLLEAFEKDGFPATIVPFSMVFGPRNITREREQKMIARLLLNRPVLIPGDGTTLGQVGSVKDQAKALEKLMMNPNSFGKRLNLTGKEHYSDESYVDTFAEVLGVSAEKVFIPAGQMDDFWEGRVDLFPEENSKPKSSVGGFSGIDIRMTDEGRRQQAAMRFKFRLGGLVQRLAPNIHKWDEDVVFGIERIKSLTGWEPEMNLADMLNDVCKWIKDEKIKAEEGFDWSMEDRILELLPQ